MVNSPHICSDTCRQDAYGDNVVFNTERNLFITSEARRLQLNGKTPCLIFVRRKDHGELLCRLLRPNLQVEVPHITAALSIVEREALRQRMIKGELLFAVCTSVWSTGIDIPNMRGLIWAPAGQAPIGLLQSLGRGTRPAADFELVDIVDEGIPNLEEQAEKREEHYKEAGFKVAKDLLRDMRSRPGGHAKKRNSRTELPPITQEDVAQAEQVYFGFAWCVALLLFLIGMVAPLL